MIAVRYQPNLSGLNGSALTTDDGVCLASEEVLSVLCVTAPSNEKPIGHMMTITGEEEALLLVRKTARLPPQAPLQPVFIATQSTCPVNLFWLTIRPIWLIGIPLMVISRMLLFQLKRFLGLERRAASTWHSPLDATALVAIAVWIFWRLGCLSLPF